MADKFIIAVKDPKGPGKILPGKVLGKYRKRENAQRDHGTLARREGLALWQVGLFHKGKLL